MPCTTGDLDNGKLIFKQYCQKCHGKRGNGQGTMAKDLEIKPRDFTDKEVMLIQAGDYLTPSSVPGVAMKAPVRAR